VRLLGEVVRLTRSRNFLVRMKPPVSEDPKDMRVVSEDLLLVGVVSDVIGPVHEPYALVKIVIPLDKAADLVGKRLYLVDRKEDRRIITYPDS